MIVIMILGEDDGDDEIHHWPSPSSSPSVGWRWAEVEIGFLGRESSTVAALRACPTLWYPMLYGDDQDSDGDGDNDNDHDDDMGDGDDNDFV